MSETALITGASAGIGRELARIHAAGGGDVVLVARREERLIELKNELESKHRVKALVIAVDLGEPDSLDRIEADLRDASMQVDILINNAGFGGYGVFLEQDIARNQAMVQLNVLALMNLTHRVVPGMVERGYGMVLNVGSTAGMIPGPTQAVYHATKAFVNSFSIALYEELRGTGVTVTLLAPGPVQTEFMEVADISDAKGLKAGVASPQYTARKGYDAMMRGRMVKVDDWRLGLLMDWVVPWVPRWLLLRIVREAFSKG